MSKRIVFIEALSPRPHIFSKAQLPRLGAVLLGTIMRDAGWDVEVYIEDIAEVDWSSALDADIAAISTITSTAPRAYGIADRFRDAGIPVIMGGVHPTFCADESLQHCDYVVRGEGETTILPLAEAIVAGRDPGKLPGLSGRDHSGSVFHNPIAGFVQNLDINPIPDYSLIRGARPRRRVTTIATSRGCPFDCVFCSVIEMFGRKYRFHSEDRVLEEIRRNGMGQGHVFFCDDNFCARPSRTKNILRRMAREGLKIQWSAQVRVEVARDVELLELMAATGCYGVYIGFESVNEKTLEAFNKHQDLAAIEKSIRQFHKYGMHVHGMFVLGSDEDDVQTIRQTALFSRDMRIDSTQFLILTPLPGTRTFNELDRTDRLLTKQWDLYDGANVVFEPIRMTPYELQKEALRAHKKFYTLTSAARHALKWDWGYAAIRYYARRQTKLTTRAVAAYTEQLRRMAAEKLRLDLSAPLNQKLKSLGIVGNWLEPDKQAILIGFLKNLGIETVLIKPDKTIIPSTEKPENQVSSSGWLAGQQAIAEKRVNELLASLKVKADGILIPMNKTLGDQLAIIEQKGESLRQWLRSNTAIGNRVCLAPDFDNTEIYKTCVQIGLAMDIKLGKIQRAYRKAIRSIEAAAPATP